MGEVKFNESGILFDHNEEIFIKPPTWFTPTGTTVRYYPLDSVTDFGTDGWNFETNSGVTFNGNAYFDGNSYLHTGFTHTINRPAGDGDGSNTIFFWFYPTDITTQNSMLHLNEIGTVHGLRFYFESGNLKTWDQAGLGSNNHYSGTFNGSLNKWQFICYTWKENLLDQYLYSGDTQNIYQLQFNGGWVYTSATNYRLCVGGKMNNQISAWTVTYPFKGYLSGLIIDYAYWDSTKIAAQAAKGPFI